MRRQSEEGGVTSDLQRNSGSRDDVIRRQYSLVKLDYADYYSYQPLNCNRSSENSSPTKPVAGFDRFYVTMNKAFTDEEEDSPPKLPPRNYKPVQTQQRQLPPPPPTGSGATEAAQGRFKETNLDEVQASLEIHRKAEAAVRNALYTAEYENSPQPDNYANQLRRSAKQYVSGRIQRPKVKPEEHHGNNLHMRTDSQLSRTSLSSIGSQQQPSDNISPRLESEYSRQSDETTRRNSGDVVVRQSLDFSKSTNQRTPSLDSNSDLRRISDSNAIAPESSSSGQRRLLEGQSDVTSLHSRTGSGTSDGGQKEQSEDQYSSGSYMYNKENVRSGFGGNYNRSEKEDHKDSSAVMTSSPSAQPLNNVDTSAAVNPPRGEMVVQSPAVVTMPPLSASTSSPWQPHGRFTATTPNSKLAEGMAPVHHPAVQQRRTSGTQQGEDQSSPSVKESIHRLETGEPWRLQVTKTPVTPPTTTLNELKQNLMRRSTENLLVAGTVVEKPAPETADYVTRGSYDFRSSHQPGFQDSSTPPQQQQPSQHIPSRTNDLLERADDVNTDSASSPSGLRRPANFAEYRTQHPSVSGVPLPSQPHPHESHGLQHNIDSVQSTTSPPDVVNGPAARLSNDVIPTSSMSIAPAPSSRRDQYKPVLRERPPVEYNASNTALVKPFTVQNQRDQSDEQLTPNRPIKHMRQKSAEEQAYDEQAAVVAGKIRDKDKRLSDVLLPPPEYKAPVDFMNGLFDTEVDVSRTPSLLLRNKPDTLKRKARRQEDAERARRDAELRAPLPPASSYWSPPGLNDVIRDETSSSSRLRSDQVLEELVERLEAKINLLEREKVLVEGDQADNDILGQEVARVVEVKVNNEKEIKQFKTYMNELDKVMQLLLKVSGRLARAENAIRNLPEDSDEKTKATLQAKLDQASEKHNDAKELKDMIELRSTSVEKHLKEHLDHEEFEDYLHYVKMKSKLMLEKQDIEDKISLGQEQLGALRRSMASSTA